MKKKRKADFFRTSQDWDEKLVLCEHWISDFDFFQMELNFFQKLLDRIFFYITDDKHEEDAMLIQKKIAQLKQKNQLMKQKAHAHIHHINQFMQQNEEVKESLIIKEHLNLENDMNSFLKEFKSTKNQLFNFAELIIESEKIASFFSKKSKKL